MISCFLCLFTVSISDGLGNIDIPSIANEASINASIGSCLSLLHLRGEVSP